jgi:hypothetical protein
MRSLFLLPVFIFLHSCSTYLTPKGQKIMVVEGLAVGTISDCSRLGPVRGYAKAGWGNEVGLNQAYNDAINRSAEYENADTFVVASTNKQFSGGTVDGIAYDCKTRKKNLIQVQSQENINSSDLIKKAKACQKEGGLWINNICQLDIEQ